MALLSYQIILPFPRVLFNLFHPISQILKKQAGILPDFRALVPAQLVADYGAHGGEGVLLVHGEAPGLEKAE